MCYPEMLSKAKFLVVYEEREATGEDISEIAQKVLELMEEIRYYRAEIFPEAARRQGITIYKEAAPASPPEFNRNPLPQIHPVEEEPEEESELEKEKELESEEEEEEEWSDTESEALLSYEDLLTDEIITPIRERLEEVAARDEDLDEEITNKLVRSYMLDAAHRAGVKTIREFNALNWEALFFEVPATEEPIVDSYDGVSGIELVRTGDIIEVRVVNLISEFLDSSNKSQYFSKTLRI